MIGHSYRLKASYSKESSISSVKKKEKTLQFRDKNMNFVNGTWWASAGKITL